MAKRIEKKKGKDGISLEEKNKIVVEYTPFIRFIAKKISKRLPANIDLEDLVSCGVIGLMDAIDKYDSQGYNLNNAEFVSEIFLDE